MGAGRHQDFQKSIGMDGGGQRRRPTPSPPPERKVVTVTAAGGVQYTVSVVLSFPVAPVKAGEVLERWWAFKGKRKQYMRDRRAGRVRK